MDKGDALGDIVPQSLNGGVHQSLLLVGNASERVGDLLNTVGLEMAMSVVHYIYVVVWGHEKKTGILHQAQRGQRRNPSRWPSQFPRLREHRVGRRSWAQLGPSRPWRPSGPSQRSYMKLATIKFNIELKTLPETSESHR